MDKHIDVFEAKEYVYLLYSPYVGKGVLKVGLTKHPQQRLYGYPRGSFYLILFACTNCRYMEGIVKSRFAALFRQRREFGTEYFECDYGIAIKEFTDVCVKVNTLCDKHPLPFMPLARTIPRHNRNTTEKTRTNTAIAPTQPRVLRHYPSHPVKMPTTRIMACSTYSRSKPTVALRM